MKDRAAAHVLAVRGPDAAAVGLGHVAADVQAQAHAVGLGGPEGIEQVGAGQGRQAFARIGLLMGRGGNWCGKQIVPAQWVDESTTTISATDRGGSVGYGYLWWTSPNNVQFGNKFGGKVFSARGHLGQYLVVVPGDDLVIAHLTDGDTKTKREVSSGDFGKIVKATLTARPAANARTDQQME